MACYLLLTLKVTYRVISNLVDLTQFNFGDLVVQERYTRAHKGGVGDITRHLCPCGGGEHKVTQGGEAAAADAISGRVIQSINDKGCAESVNTQGWKARDTSAA